MAVVAYSMSLPASLRPGACALDDQLSLLQHQSAVARGRSLSEQARLVQDGLSEVLAEFEDTYPWDRDTASPQYAFRIKGLRPKDAGTFPVYLYLPGTGDEFATPHDFELLQYMAHKGFVSATVEYPNDDFCYQVCRPEGEACTRSFFGTSITLIEKARKIFTAIDSICATYHADCEQGVAVMGHGQGGFLALILTLLDSRISAVMPMGVGLLAESVPGLDVWERDTQCIWDASISKHLPRSKRRYIDGDSPSLTKAELTKADGTGLAKYSGYACEVRSAPVNCIQKDGSGYYIVAEQEHKRDAGHGKANNSFFEMRHPEGKASVLPSMYKHCSAPWCMQPSLDWLATAAKRMIDSQG
jgi:hypothetical protein